MPERTPAPQAADSLEKPAVAGAPSRRWLYGVMLLYLVLHVGYARVSPPMAGPDEPQHVQYIISLAEYHQIPVFDFMRNDYSARPMVVHTALHGPVYYALMVPVYLAVRGRGETFTDLAMRHATGLLGLAFIWLAYAAFARVFGDGLTTRAATAATALHPLTLYLGGHVTNEMLAAVWAALALYFLACAAAGDARIHPWVGAGTALALGLLTKYTAIVVGFAAAALLISQWRRERFSLATVVGRAAALILPTLVLGGWWFARNLQQHGTLFVLQYSRPLFENGYLQALLLPEALLPVIAGVLWGITRSYVGPLWLFRPCLLFINVVSTLYTLFFLMPVVGWLRSRRASRRASGSERDFLILCGAALLANVAGVMNTCLFKQGAMFGFAGRFLLVSLAPTMLLCVAGVSGLPRRPDRTAKVVHAFCAFLALQNAWLIPAVWWFYHP